MKILNKIINHKPKVVSWESNIAFIKDYKNYGNVVVKTYKKDSPCVSWLNSHLENYYPFKTIMPVAQHEFRALEVLSKEGISPSPIEIGTDYIILEKYGQELDNPDNSLYPQAEKIFNRLIELNFKHNDLLMRNILIDKNKVLKLIDFTLSEFDGIEIIKDLPDKNWAYPGDERILKYFE